MSSARGLTYAGCGRQRHGVPVGEDPVRLAPARTAPEPTTAREPRLAEQRRRDLPAPPPGQGELAGGDVPLVAVATSHDRTVAGGAALPHVEYTFNVGGNTVGKIAFSVGRPPAGKVSDPKITRFGF